MSFCFRRIVPFIFLGDSPKSRFPLRRIFVWRKVKTAFYVSRWTFWRNSILQWKKTFTLHFPKNGRKNSGLVSELFKRVCQNCNFRFYWNLSREIIPFGEIGFFNLFEILSKKFSAVFQEVLGGVIKTAFYVSKGTTWWKNFDFFLYEYPTLGEKFSSVSRKKLAGISELLSKSPYEFFCGKHPFLKWSFSWFFPDLIGTFSHFCLNFPAWFSKLLSISPCELFEENCYCWVDIRHNNFQTWVETCYTDFCWNFPAGLSKLLPTSPYVKFGKKIFLKE